MRIIYHGGCLSFIVYVAMVVLVFKLGCMGLGELEYRCQGWQQRMRECADHCAHLEQERPIGCSWEQVQ